MANQRFLLPGSERPIHPFYDKLRKYQEGIRIDKFSDFERTIASNREFRLKKLRSTSQHPPPNKNEVIENIHNKLSRKHHLDGSIEKFIFRTKPYYGAEYSNIPTVTEAEEGTNYRYFMAAAAELLGMKTYVNPEKNKYAYVSGKVSTGRSSSTRRTGRPGQNKSMSKDISSGQGTIKVEDLSPQRSKATVTEARSVEENEQTDREARIEEQRKVFFQDPNALRKLSEMFLKSRRGSMNSSEAIHILKPASQSKDEFPMIEGMLERGAIPIPPEYDIDDSTRFKFIYQKLKNAAERIRLGIETRPKTPPKSRKPGERPQLAKILVQAKKDSLPLISETGESPTLKPRHVEYSTFDNSGQKPGSAELSASRQRRNQINQLNEKFHSLKTVMTRAFGEASEKHLMKKLEQNCSKVNKTYDSLDRRLNRQKPHLYDFEDYLNCAYGEDYSTDEYAIALKARPLEVDKHELGNLIKQVQLEKYNF